MDRDFLRHLEAYERECARRDYKAALSEINAAFDVCPSPLFYGYLSILRDNCIRRQPWAWARLFLRKQ